MDHRRLITDTIAKYDAYPTIQADIRRVLRYAESQTRMFLTPIIKPAVDQRLEDIASTVTRPDFQATVAQLRDLYRRAVTDKEDNTAAIRDLLTSLKGDPEALKAGFAAADVILEAILDGDIQ